MAVKLKKSRNYTWDVPWSLDDDQGGTMQATFYLPTQEEFDKIDSGDKATMLELVLKGVEGLEIEDGNNTITDFKALKPIVIGDPEISRAFYDAFMELWAKKTLPATSLMQVQTIMGLIREQQPVSESKDLVQD